MKFPKAVYANIVLTYFLNTNAITDGQSENMMPQAPVSSADIKIVH